MRLLKFIIIINNLFEAAASLHYHREDIHDCLGSCLAKQNRKLESVYEDNACEEIDVQLIALGLIFYRITGPYWCLLGTVLHYLEFYRHVVQLHQLFQAWTTDASSAFDDNFEALFGLHFKQNPDVLQSLIQTTDQKKERVKNVLQNLCAGFTSVTERQLADFLPQGKYHEVKDPALHDKMKHSHITNLVGEQCFGDLDFSIFKRRSASVHHHTTVNIMKRNKMVSVWFLGKTEEEQNRWLALSAKKSAALRQKHIAAEKDSVAKRTVLLEEVRQKKQDAADKRRKQIQDIMATMQHHHGPCVTAAAVDALLAAYSTRASQKAAVKAELRYHKQVLCEKSSLLNVTGTLQHLVRNLKRFLGAEVEEEIQLPSLPAAHQPRPKRRRIQPEEDHQNCDSTDTANSD